MRNYKDISDYELGYEVGYRETLRNLKESVHSLDEDGYEMYKQLPKKNTTIEIYADDFGKYKVKVTLGGRTTYLSKEMDSREKAITEAQNVTNILQKDESAFSDLVRRGEYELKK